MQQEQPPPQQQWQAPPPNVPAAFRKFAERTPGEDEAYDPGSW